MNEPISGKDKQLRDTPQVALVTAIFMNKGQRNACLFFGIIALVVILFAGWSKWLLLFPAALGIGSFLFQMNIFIVSSELRRRSQHPEEEPTPYEAEEVDEGLDETPDVDDIPRIVFGCTAAFWAGIAGAIVGFLWAHALSLSLTYGAILGACINAFFWVLVSLAATATGRIKHREAAFVMGGAMPLLCGLLTIVALVVWGIRLLL